MDIYPDVVIELGLLSRNGLLTRLLKYLQRLSLTNASQVIAIGDCMKRQLIERGVHPNNISVIPNWANNKSITNSSTSSPLPELDDKFVILYSGNIGASHFFDDILQASLRLSNSNRYHFLFIGKGSRRKEIETFLQNNEISNITLIPPVSENELNSYLNLASIHFVSLRNEFDGLVVPSKTYGALATGKPVIFQGPSTSEIAKLLIESKAGSVSEIGDIDNLVNQIQKYGTNSEFYNEHSTAAKEAIDNVYNQNVAFEQYWEILNKYKPTCINQ